MGMVLISHRLVGVVHEKAWSLLKHAVQVKSINVKQGALGQVQLPPLSPSPADPEA